MTLVNVLALFGAMLVLAFMPSASVVTVAARSAASGFVHGVFTTMGIIAGDIVFILIAIYGLALLADVLGSYFVLVKYAGGAYLIWLGTVVLRSRPEAGQARRDTDASLLSSFFAGLLLTLGDQKVILFYLGFFPAFIDLATVSSMDMTIILTIVVVAVGGAKLSYAYLADRAGLLLQKSKVFKAVNRVAAGVMIAVGLFLITGA